MPVVKYEVTGRVVGYKIGEVVEFKDDEVPRIFKGRVRKIPTGGGGNEGAEGKSIIEEAKDEATKIIDDAKKEAEQIIEEAKTTADELVKAAMNEQPKSPAKK